MIPGADQWARIIKESSRDPASLASLAILVVGGVNAAMLVSAHAPTLPLIASIALSVVTILVLVLASARSRGGARPSSAPSAAPLRHADDATNQEARDRVRYDIFLSMPMASTVSPEKYEEARAFAISWKRTLTERHRLSVYFGGETIEKRPDFENHDEALSKSFGALMNSEAFVLVYPTRVVSSCLIELGMAMVRGIPVVVFVSDKRQLPFLMQGPDTGTTKVYELGASVLEQVGGTLERNTTCIGFLTGSRMPSLPPPKPSRAGGGPQ